MSKQNPTSAEVIMQAQKNWAEVLTANPAFVALDSRLRKLEDASAWLQEPPKSDTSETLAMILELREALLWVLKQPWERDLENWSELIKLMATPKPTSKGFRETVSVGPPIDKMTVRDLL